MPRALHLEIPAGKAASRTLYPRYRIYGVLAFAFALAIIAFVVIVAPGRHSEEQPAPRAKPALTVTSATPLEAMWPATIDASGAIAAWQEASVGTQIGSFQLIDVLVNVGDQVKKGQILARLDPALLRADEAQLQASYDQAEANRQRAVRLQSIGGISDQEALQFVTQAKTISAALAAKRLQLSYTEVRAPDDGAISFRTATLGAVVPAGQELFRLIRQNRLEWRGELTAAQLAQIRAGQHIVLNLPDGSEATAKVRQTAPSLDPQSRLGIVYADLEPGSRARSGMYAKGRVVLTQSRALLIPAQAVVIRDGRSYVLKLADTSSTPSVSLQAVTVGRRQGSEVEIVEGIAGGDRVVVQGAGFLNDGDVVRLVTTETDAGARQGPAP